MSHLYRSSFLALLATLFLLPIFFVPGGSLDLGNAKSLVLVVGILVATGLFLVEFIKKRELTLPKHFLLLASILLPVVYFLSALLSTPSSLSLFGYNLEAGTFGSIILGVALLLLAAVVVSDAARAFGLILAFAAALGVLAFFVTAKILSGGSLFVLGNFVGNMGNPLGSWTDLAIAFTLLALLVMLTISMLPIRGLFRLASYVVFFLSLALMAVINFAPAFILALAASIAFFFYFQYIESGFHFQKGEGRRLARPIILPIILGLVSLAFLVNPTLPGTSNTLGGVLSGAVHISNTDVHPTLSTTLSISKAVLSDRSLFGSGPNTFTRDWLIYKPADVNSTAFWAVEFLFGAGFIPTQVALTGIVGSIAWLTFFVLLVWLVLKIVTRVPESRPLRFATISVASVTVFLWVASFLYTPSLALLVTAFAFTGALVGLGRISGVLSSASFRLTESPARGLSTVFVVVILAGAAGFAWFECARVRAAIHFNRASALSHTEGASPATIESEVEKAISLAPLDAYYLTLSQINTAKAQAIASSATGTPEETQASFEQAVAKSISAARAAVDVNPARYGNWIALGQLYSSLVPEPLKVEGAYESAQFAYNEAFKRNPSNPELPLLLAQLEINKGNMEEARSFVRNSLALKSDYADAYILLARIEVASNNIPAAIASAEQVATLLPDNVGIQFELGLLKYSHADYTGALTAFQKALALSPDYANARYYLGLSLIKLGRTDEARRALEALKDGNPDSAELKAALESLTPASKK